MAPSRGGSSPSQSPAARRRELLERFGDVQPPSSPLLLHIVARHTAAAEDNHSGDVLAEVFVSPTDMVLHLRQALASAAGVAHLQGLCSVEGVPIADHLSVEAAGLRNHSEVLTSVAVELVVASASCDCDVRIWDAEAGRCLDAMRAHEEPVQCALLSPLGRLLASCSADCTARLWSTGTRECLATLAEHSDWVNAAAFAPNECTLATASMDCTAKVWDIETAACVRTLCRTVFPLLAAAFSPCGTLLAVAGAPTSHDAQLWDPRAGGAAAQVLKGGGTSGHQDSVLCVCFSPDGQAVLTGCQDKSAKFWDLRSASCTQTLKGHGDAVASAGFTPDGRQVLTGSSDRSIKLWEVESAQCLKTLRGHTGAFGAAG